MALAGIKGQPNDIELSWEGALEALAAMADQRVAVRVVERENPENLIVTMRGHLGHLTDDRLPTFFLPVCADSEDENDDLECAGIYLRHELFDGAAQRGDVTALLISQGSIVINLRPLDIDFAD